MTADWTALDAELAAWDQASLTLPLWWRDDDAVEATPALDQLSEMAGRLGVPVHLAIIPAYVQKSLVTAIAARPLSPMVHGWSHHNHAPEGQKRSEYPDRRPLEERVDEVTESLAILTGLFGDALCPVFVPPWNRITPDLVAELPAIGFTGLSTFTPRDSATAAPGLTRINTHLDPIAWQDRKSLIDPDMLISQVARQLADRRTGVADNAEPYGILTHHLVHDSGIWAFTEQLISRLMRGPAIAWIAPKQGLRHEPT
ncbi:MAG: polysaccharide deacetylase family protein [Rhodobacteraceae bacterium]|nr:polysaccharide deacetylase family protein [Paracoccaceae bacterium]